MVLWNESKAIIELIPKIEEIKKTFKILWTDKVKKLQEMKASLTRDIPMALEEVERTFTWQQLLLRTNHGILFRKQLEKADPLQPFTSLEASSPLDVHRTVIPQDGEETSNRPEGLAMFGRAASAN